MSPHSEATAFADVPNPRRATTMTYPPAALLAWAVRAILVNRLFVLAIAEWGTRQTPNHLRTLGFPDGRTSSQSTVQRLFCQLDGPLLGRVLSRWFAPKVIPLADALQGRDHWQGQARSVLVCKSWWPGPSCDRLRSRILDRPRPGTAHHNHRQGLG